MPEKNPNWGGRRSTTLKPGERLAVPENRRCQATSHTTGDRCPNAAIKGGRVCSAHGGILPSVRAAADRKLEAERIEKMFERWQPELVPDGGDIDVLDQLLKTASVMIAWRDFMGERIAAMRAEEFRYTGQAGEQLRSEVSLFERSVERAGKFLNDLAKLNLEERRVKIAEGQARQLLQVIRNVMRDLDLTPEQQRKAAVSLPKRLRQLGEDYPSDAED